MELTQRINVITVMRAPLALCLFALPALAQQTAQPPHFDVTSVRSGDLNQRPHLHTEPGLVLFENVTMRGIIEFAYGIPSYQLSAPDWIDREAFNINARAADRNANDDALRLMLRLLLADRFDMKIHHEQKQLPVFLLALAKNGPKFHEAATANASKFVESKSKGDPVFSADKTGLIVARATMSDLASKLASPLRQPVIDKTGLTARYDLRIDTGPYNTPGSNDEHGPTIDDPVSFVVTAFQDQLGLRLEAGKEIVDFLVVDTLNRTPSEN